MATRNRQGRADLEDRIAALETELAALRRRLVRIEAGNARLLLPAPAPERKASDSKGGRCPGCSLAVTEPAERCAYCSLPFHVLPAHLRPAFAAPKRPPSSPGAAKQRLIRRQGTKT